MKDFRGRLGLSSSLFFLLVLAFIGTTFTHCSNTIGGGGGDDRPPATLNSCSESWPIKRFLLMYGGELVGDRSEEELDSIARRFEFSVGEPDATVKDLLSRDKTVYKGTYRYNSLTDNYVTSASGTPEHSWLMANAASYGVTNDGAYLHYDEDTVIELGGETLNIPGWDGSGQSNREASRIPLYYSNLSRRAANFSTPEALALYRDYNIEEVLGQPVVDEIYPLGIMFDNSSPTIFNFGSIQSGGKVHEHPTRAKMGSNEYNSWHWESNIGNFINELRRYIKDNPSSVGNRETGIMPNISNAPWITSGTAWEDAYTNFLENGGFYLMEEFQYSPTRVYGTSMPESIFQKESDAHDVGIHTIHSAHPTKTINGRAGEYTLEETAMNNLAMHWVVRSSSTTQDAHSYLLGIQINDPAGDWENWSANLLGAFDADLGQPQGDPYVLAEGTDGKGYDYRVYGREFVCGLAVVRVRGSYDEDFDDGTAVGFDLGGTYIPLEPTGHSMDETTSWSLRNGSGQIFLKL